MATAAIRGGSVDTEREAIKAELRAEMAYRLDQMDVGDDALMTREEWEEIAFGGWGGHEDEQLYIERTEVEP